MNRYIPRFLLSVGWLFMLLPCHSQISFLEDIPTDIEFELREIKGVVELPNGNFCAIVIEDDVTQETSRVQSVFLFDQCGKYIEDVKFLNTDDYVEFFNVTTFQGEILLLGYYVEGGFYDYALMLDADDLSVVNEKKHLDYNLKHELVNTGPDRIWYVGVSNNNLYFSLYNQELDREVNLEGEHSDENVRSLRLLNATKTHIYYSKTFYNSGYSEIGIADYSLNEIATIKGSSIHGSIRFGELVFVNDSIYYTTAIYALDEGLYYRKYILDSMVYEKAIDPLSRIGQGMHYDVVDDQFKVIYSDKSYRTFDIESADLLSEKILFPDSITQLRRLGTIKTNDQGILSVNSRWTYINNVWQSYIRLIKLNSDLELDLTSPSPCIVSNEDVFVNEFDVTIGSNPNLGSFSIICDAKLSAIELYGAGGNKVKVTIIPNTSYGYQVSTDYKGLAVVIIKRNDGIQVSRKVMIY